MSSQRGPLAVARAAVALVVGLLPAGTPRARYRAEFTAELHALAPAAQLAYAVNLFCAAPALGTALRGKAMPDPARNRPFWRCRVFRWHDFVVRSTSDGGRYQVCRYCGRDRGPISALPTTTPPARGPL